MKDYNAIDNQKGYASSAKAVALAASATDVFTIFGSSTKTVSLRQIIISGIATAATAATINIIKRSTANSAGTSAAMTAIPLDSNYAAATASCLSYTANPTTGNAVGTPICVRASLEVAASATVQPYVIDLSTTPIVLHGTGEGICVNFDGVSISGGAVSCTFIWTEQ